MKVGDRVVVSDPKLKSYLKTGVIQSLAYAYPENIWEVRLNDRKWITIKESKLEVANSVDEDQMMTSVDSQKYLAFVHYHDFDRNPESIEDALDMFDEAELGQPELTVYGTKEEILQHIIDNGDYVSYENVFIIINQDIYPVETSISVKW